MVFPSACFCVLQVVFPTTATTDSEAIDQLAAIAAAIAADASTTTDSAVRSMHTMTAFTPYFRKCKLVDCSGSGSWGYASILRVSPTTYAVAVLIADIVSIRDIYTDFSSTPTVASANFIDSLNLPPFLVSNKEADVSTTAFGQCKNTPISSWNHHLKLYNTLLLPGYGYALTANQATLLSNYDFGIIASKYGNSLSYRCQDDSYVVGDPQFIGLRGQNYQVHGVAGEIYNIVSDDEMQYNSRFVFLHSGECPVVDGRKQKGCFAHPGSYLGELGLKTRSGDKIHLVSGCAHSGFAEVTVNGSPVPVGVTIDLADGMGSVSRNTTHLATVSIGNWGFDFENSDMFVNQRVRVLDARGLRSHGLLGQTWREATYPNTIKYVQGAVDDYVIRDKNIFGDNFVYNMFN